MSKKMLAMVLFVTIAFIPLLSIADTSWMTMPANYAMWAKYYFNTDISDEINTLQRDDAGNTVMSMDQIMTYSNPETMDLVKVSLVYFDFDTLITKSSAIDTYNRVLSFYLAIENGKYMDLTMAEISNAVDQAMDFSRKIPQASDSKFIDASDGKYAEFYSTEKGTYCLRFEDESFMKIYFFPVGQYPPK